MSATHDTYILHGGGRFGRWTAVTSHFSHLALSPHNQHGRRYGEVQRKRVVYVMTSKNTAQKAKSDAK